MSVEGDVYGRNPSISDENKFAEPVPCMNSVVFALPTNASSLLLALLLQMFTCRLVADWVGLHGHKMKEIKLNIQ